MSYMQGACGVSRWDRESNEDMYRRFGMSETAVGMDCGVVEWVLVEGVGLSLEGEGVEIVYGVVVAGVEVVGV